MFLILDTITITFSDVVGESRQKVEYPITEHFLGQPGLKFIDVHFGGYIFDYLVELLTHVVVIL